MKKIALAALLLFAGTPMAFCAGYDDLNAGISYLNLGRYDDAVIWLDKAIADGDLIPDHLRVANLDRGLIYFAKHDTQKALDAFTAAIAAQPDDLTAYHERINIYNVNGMLEKALADFETMNRLRPHDYRTVINMGWTNWFLDRPEASAAAFAQFPQNSYAWLWLQVANVRIGKPMDAVPADVPAASPWPAAAVRFFHGDIGEAEMLTVAANNKGAGVCHGNVFAGLWRRVHDDAAGARPLFETAVTTCQRGNPYWEVAKRELARPNAEAKAP